MFWIQQYTLVTLYMLILTVVINHQQENMGLGQHSKRRKEKGVHMS